jgi:hypothetical protein
VRCVLFFVRYWGGVGEFSRLVQPSIRIPCLLAIIRKAVDLCSLPKLSLPMEAVAYIDINAPLVERCRVNDRQAQAELYRRYSKAMFNAALRITGDYAEAEDVLQESFLSAFRELSGYKGDSSFGAWLKRIVVNKSINCLRQRRLHSRATRRIPGCIVTVFARRV